MKLVEKGFKINELDVNLDIYIIGENEWFKAQDITDVLGYTDSSQAVRKNVSNTNKLKKYALKNNYMFLNKYGIVELIQKTNKIDVGKKERIFSELGVSGYVFSREEVNFGNILKEALKELKLEVVDQYKVDNYRVDFYIPKKNLAIEYDEQHHFVEDNTIKDLERQKYIESKLGCKFVRCDYRDSDIKNLMKVLREVM